MISSLYSKIKPTVELASRPFLSFSPDSLSIIGMLLYFPGCWFYTQGNALGGSLFILGAGFDAVDGTVARLTGKVSKWGGILDATLDRIADGLILWAIGIGNLVPWSWLFAAYVSFIGVSYIKAKAEAVISSSNIGRNRFSVGIAERSERLVLLFGASLLEPVVSLGQYSLISVTILVLTLLSVVTILWRGRVIYNALEEN